MRTIPPFLFSLDCETVGLYGEVFAVGICVIDTRTAATAFEAYFACPLPTAEGTPHDRQWITENVITALGVKIGLDLTVLPDPPAVRGLLAALWLRWQLRGAVMLADCPYPCESMTLAVAFAEAMHEQRLCPSPYPLLDLASMIFAKGGDPLATQSRLPYELPIHNPLCDARQTARLALELLDE